METKYAKDLTHAAADYEKKLKNQIDIIVKLQQWQTDHTVQMEQNMIENSKKLLDFKHTCEENTLRFNSAARLQSWYKRCIQQRQEKLHLHMLGLALRKEMMQNKQRLILEVDGAVVDKEEQETTQQQKS